MQYMMYTIEYDNIELLLENWIASRCVCFIICINNIAYIVQIEREQNK